MVKIVLVAYKHNGEAIMQKLLKYNERSSSPVYELAIFYALILLESCCRWSLCGHTEVESESEKRSGFGDFWVVVCNTM